MYGNFQSYQDFWKAYLRDHSSRANRILHYLGTALALVCLTFLVLSGDLEWLLLAAFFWISLPLLGHALFQRAQVESGEMPFWSTYSEFRMFLFMLTFQLGRERKKAEAERPGRRRSRAKSTAAMVQVAAAAQPVLSQPVIQPPPPPLPSTTPPPPPPPAPAAG